MGLAQIYLQDDLIIFGSGERPVSAAVPGLTRQGPLSKPEALLELLDLYRSPPCEGKINKNKKPLLL